MLEQGKIQRTTYIPYRNNYILLVLTSPKGKSSNVPHLKELHIAYIDYYSFSFSFFFIPRDVALVAWTRGC